MAGFFGSAEQAMSICQAHLEQTTAAGAGFARSWAQLALALALTKHGDAEEALQLGSAALHARLAAVDPAAAARLHPNDLRRLVRALEVWELTGRPISDWQRQWADPPAEGTWQAFWLDLPRPELYERFLPGWRELNPVTRADAEDGFRRKANKYRQSHQRLGKRR